MHIVYIQDKVMFMFITEHYRHYNNHLMYIAHTIQGENSLLKTAINITNITEQRLTEVKHALHQ